MWDLKTLPEKLQNIPLSNIIVLADYDLTLAEKDLKNFDRAPLTTQQYVGLQKFSQEIGRFNIVTARGERSTLSYMREHEDNCGPIDLTIASNSGHVILSSTIHLDEDRTIVPIPIHAPEYLHKIVVGIHRTIEAVKNRFPSITADYRRLCGAVVYNFFGKEDSTEHMSLHKEIDNQLRICAGAVSGDIDMAKKHRAVESERGVLTQGYVDFKPTGMDKGIVTQQLYEQGLKMAGQNPFVIVAGDSEPDFAMMKKVDELVPSEQRLFVSVGKGLVHADQQHQRRTGSALLDMVLIENGHSPVQSLHNLFNLAARDLPRMNATSNERRNGAVRHDLSVMSGQLARCESW